MIAMDFPGIERNDRRGEIYYTEKIKKVKDISGIKNNFNKRHIGENYTFFSVCSS